MNDRKVLMTTTMTTMMMINFSIPIM